MISKVLDTLHISIKSLSLETFSQRCENILIGVVKAEKKVSVRKSTLTKNPLLYLVAQGNPGTRIEFLRKPHLL